MSDKTNQGTNKSAAPDRSGTKSPRPAKRPRTVIGEQLRQMYDEVVREPVPDDFLELLKQAETAAEKNGSEESGIP